MRIKNFIKDVKPYYEITKDGKVFGKCGKLLSTRMNSSGYKHVLLMCTDGKARNFLTHRLVALAFIPNLLNKPQVNHIDENKLNNDITNLEWVTMVENLTHGTCKERRARSLRKKSEAERGKPKVNISHYENKAIPRNRFKEVCKLNNVNMENYDEVFSHFYTASKSGKRQSRYFYVRKEEV